MAHLRKLIRDNVITTLTGLATTGSNVFNTRIYPNEAEKLPLICIFTPSESTERLTMGSDPKYMRDLTLLVEGYARANSGIQNTMDQIALEVEEALAVDASRGGYAKDTILESTEVEFSGEGDKPISILRLTYKVEYVASSKDVETTG